MQNSTNEDQEKLDQRKPTAMEDSAMMTIEYLRARLLSERSVSRTARLRADDLAKRVMELEEQLKLVTHQRKKAEKATTEVLAILENHEISDFSDAFDSSSDQEGVLSDSKEGNNSMKEETSRTLRPRRNEEEELSGSELEGSPLPGRSLSWKSSKDNPNSLEKKKFIDHARRRRSNFLSNGGSSPKDRMGKSCRKIKRRETISAVNEVIDESLLLDAQENRVASHSGDISNSFINGPGLLKEGSTNEEEMEDLEYQRNIINPELYVNGSGKDTDMERALEQQAQLIDRYEAEEDAQRVWEEKFRENDNCTPDSCEPGNQSDITEEREEARAETTEPADTNPSHDQEETSQTEDVCRSGEAIASTPNGFQRNIHIDMGHQQSSSTLVSDSPTDFTFQGQEKLEPGAKEKQKQERLENNPIHPPSNGSPEQQSSQFSPFHPGGSFDKGESSGNQDKLKVMTQPETSSELGGVLKALQRAKLTLEQELSFPISSQHRSLVRAVETAVPAIKARDAMDIPVGSAGLFRVPNDVQFEAKLPRANILGPYSESGLSLTRHYSDIGARVAIGDQYTSNQPIESVSRIPTWRPSVVPYMDTGMGLTTPSRYTYPSFKSSVDPYMDTGMGLSTPSRYTYPSWKPNMDSYMDTGMGLSALSRYTYPSNAGLIPRMASTGVFPRSNPSTEPGLPARDHFTVYEDQIRPNMHG